MTRGASQEPFEGPRTIAVGGGCAAQKEDLARMYRLFQRIPRGLDPVADIFKKHVESEGMKLVKEVTEAMSSKKDRDAGAGLLPPRVWGTGLRVTQATQNSAKDRDAGAGLLPRVWGTGLKEVTQAMSFKKDRDARAGATLGLGGQGSRPPRPCKTPRRTGAPERGCS